MDSHRRLPALRRYKSLVNGIKKKYEVGGNFPPSSTFSIILLGSAHRHLGKELCDTLVWFWIID